MSVPSALSPSKGEWNVFGSPLETCLAALPLGFFDLPWYYTDKTLYQEIPWDCSIG